MKLSFVMLFIFMLITFLSGNIYVAFKIWHLSPNYVVKWFLLTAQTLLVVFLILSLSFRNVFPQSIIIPIYKIGTAALFVMIYLIIIFLLLDLLKIINLIPKEWLYSNGYTLGILTITIISIFSYGYLHYNNKIRNEININYKNESHKSYKILAISDLHLGYNVNNSELSKWIEIFNKEAPDLILIGGDLIDNTTKPLNTWKTDTVLSQIKTKLGIFAVLGNHEAISGREASIDFLRRSGITVLVDNSILVDSNIFIIGRDDYSNKSRSSLQDLCSNIDTSKFTILIDHQPQVLQDAVNQKINLQFSGHTHDGQLFPINLITKKMYELSSGSKRINNSIFIVSSGIGIWGGKFRIGTDSEYWIINLIDA